MPVKHGLPENHPFKHGLIIFGAKRPKASTKPSTTEESSTSGQQLPDEDQIRIHNLMEKALEETLREANTPFQSPKPITPKSGEKN